MSKKITAKLRNTRSMRLATLLLTSLLIGTASAAVYQQLWMNANITAAAATVKFTSGNDGASAGATISTDGTYVKFNSLGGWPNATRIYTEAVNITNSDTGSHTISVVFSSLTGTIGTSYFRVQMMNNQGVLQASILTINTSTTAGATTGTATIPNGATGIWSLQFQVNWASGTSAGTSAAIVLYLQVT